MKPEDFRASATRPFTGEEYLASLRESAWRGCQASPPFSGSNAPPSTTRVCPVM